MYFESIKCHHGNRLVNDVGCAVTTACGCRFDHFGKWKPTKLLMKLIADDGREFDDNEPELRLWLMEPAQEKVFHQACRTNKLGKSACRNMWRATGRSDRAPKSLTIYLREI